MTIVDKRGDNLPIVASFFMPITHRTEVLHLLPGLEQKNWRNHWSLKSEFVEFDWRAPRSFKTWPVDNLWISLEFGEFNERTYRYDYHASLLGGISLGKPF